MTEQKPTYDGGIGDLAKALINDLVESSNELPYGSTAREKIANYLKLEAGQNTLNGISALSGYVNARSQERQATALEALVKTVGKLESTSSTDTGGQAIIDQRESRREYLATTFSLPTETLSLLWAMRGMLMDASIRALSRPDRFDPFQRVTTDMIAWALRLTSDVFVGMLPRNSQGEIDYALLEEFDIVRYGGTDDFPDDWMYGG